MGTIIPFESKSIDNVECGDPRVQDAADLRAFSLGLSAISASLQSAADHGRAMTLHLRRYKESFRDAKDFCEACAAAAEMPSLAEMVKARDELAIGPKG